MPSKRQPVAKSDPPVPKRRAAPARPPARRSTLAERAGERRARLIEAAIRLYGARGYHMTKVRDICLEAGLTERYFYESFTNSEELLFAAYNVAVERMFASLEGALPGAEPTPEARMRAVLCAYFVEAARDPAAARLLVLEARSISPQAFAAARKTQKRLAALLLGIISDDGKRVARDGLSGWALTEALTNAFNASAVAWVEGGFAAPLEEVLRTTMAIYRAIETIWLPLP